MRTEIKRHLMLDARYLMKPQDYTRLPPDFFCFPAEYTEYAENRKLTGQTAEFPR